MPSPSKSNLSALQATISKMSLEACCVAVLPELGLRWSDVSRAMRSARLAITPASAARVLCRHIEKSLPVEEYDDLLSRLRLKLVATQKRVWHLISLSEPVTEASEGTAVRALSSRVRQALRNAKKPKDMIGMVESVNIGDLVYLSVQLVSASRQGSVLFCAVPQGRPVALLSSLGAKTLLKALVEGLGYKAYEDECLHGRDITSLLRIHDRRWNDDNVPSVAVEYRPLPVFTQNGIDYTNKGYNEEYMEKVLGPQPPLLTDLKIQTSKPFFQPRLRKDINLTITLKSRNVAATLKEWVRKGALKPTSPLVQIFQELRSNSISCTTD